ncbi:MAG: motility protein A, partial [Treponema sp.]|nr:motility protein A [Treponema sp.]
MDISTIIGLVGCFAMVALGIITGGSGLLTFVDIPSVLIVVLGSYFGLYTFSSVSNAVGVFSLLKLCFKIPQFDEKSLITKMMAMSEKARREGLLALEEELEDLDEEFMKKGMRLVVDG